MSTHSPSPSPPPSSGAATRVLVVDDNPVVRAGLVALLEGEGSVTVVAEAGDGHQALDRARSTRPEVTLLDVRMPRLDGLQALAELSQHTHVLMLTHTEDPEVVREAVQAGASGYLVHGAFSTRELLGAIHTVARGERSPLSPTAASALIDTVREQGTASAADTTAPEAELTEREVEVMTRIAAGLSNTEIAAELMLSEKTVKNHVNRLYAKLGVPHRSAAVAKWRGVYREPERA